MNNELIHDVALELLEAEQNQQPIVRFTKERYPLMTLKEAYLIQEALIQLKRVEGQQVLAPKIGLSSKKLMQQYGIDQPIYGFLFQEMQTDNEISLSNYIQPKAEAEIVIVLKKDLMGPNVSSEDVLANIAYLFSAVEIIDSRYISGEYQLSDIIADNSQASGFIFSERFDDFKVEDLRNETVSIKVNDSYYYQDLNINEHPAVAVASLANLLGTKGQKLQRNVPILTGGMTPPINLNVGDTIEMQFSSLPTIKLNIKK